MSIQKNRGQSGRLEEGKTALKRVEKTNVEKKRIDLLLSKEV